MSKDKIADYDGSTAGNNTDIGGISIAEGMLPSAVNNSMRELTKQLGAFSDGTDGIDVLNLHDDDASASIKIQAPSAVTTTTTLTLPDGDGDAGAMLQTNGSGQLAWSTAYRNRNLIINGAMQVAQRGTSTSITAAGSYFSPDRFEVGITATDQLAATLSQSTTAPSGFSNSLKFEVTTAETTLAADEIVTLRQKFEGQDLQRLAKGTSSAEQVTASFWVRSSNTGTYILELFDSDNTRQVSKSYTINSANTWEYKTLTFPADTTGAFDNDNNLSLFFMFWLAAGSNYTSGTLNTSWASATTANRVVGQTNLIASTNDFYITGIQMEIGEQATPFEHRSYGDELAACQRYYFQETKPIYGVFTVGRVFNSKTPQFGYSFPVPMRTLPSISNVGSGCGVWFSSGSETQLSNPSFYQDNTSGTDLIKGSLVFSANSNLSDNNGVALCSHAADSGLAFSAEL